MAADPQIGAVVIGRNEGDRLIRCLDTVRCRVAHVVYVDSGSTDNSVAEARARDVEVVALDLKIPFTAARARNAGLDALLARGAFDYVQFIDGDCELREGWIDAACAFLQQHENVAVVCGRRRERFPDATVYNRLCDWEWDTPVGEATACGGDALMRVAALRAVGGYNPDLIAGEEPELCVRMRLNGWWIWRLDHEMTWHDAAMTRFGQFWKRNRRSGHAFAEGAALHGRRPTRHWVAETRRAILWGAAGPVAILLLAVWAGPAAFWLVLIYLGRLIRIALREGGNRVAWERAFLLVVGKFAEVIGVAEYWLGRLRRRRGRLIEYK